MQQPEKKPKEKLSTSEKLEQFLQKNRKPLLISVSVIVLGLIVFGIVTTVQSRRMTDFTERVETVQQRFNQEYTSADADERDAISAELQSDLADILGSVRRGYPALRALMISGELAYQEERFADAKEYFLKAADEYSRTYLAPVALMNAAVTSEKLEDIDRSIELFQRIVDSYSDTFQGAPRALLNIGRLYETQENIDAAVIAYEQITEDYAGSEWAKLARTRLIQIEIGMH